VGDGATRAARRALAGHAAAEILGVARVAFLDYVDSGMVGTPTNDEPGSFWSTDVEEAAQRLANVLREEQADVLTVYDAHGGYGHPDHIQVHRVGVRAAELAGTARVYEATMNRDHLKAGILAAATEGAPPEDLPTEVELDELGMPDEAITTGVDITAWLDRKRAAMRAHASQIGDQSFFLAMPEEMFAYSFGTEWFVRRGMPTPVAVRETSLFD
jgi:LmbE family N-acetylglucosaminyl deacetylase